MPSDGRWRTTAAAILSLVSSFVPCSATAGHPVSSSLAAAHMDRLDGDGGPAVPVFISKLWDLVGSGNHAELIGWSAGGRSVVIHNTFQFARELLPLYFKHNHMDSFTRQLNTYGFRNGMDGKQDGGVKRKFGETVFHHPSFQMGHATLLSSIKRRTPEKVTAVEAPEMTTSEQLDQLAHVMERQDALEDFMLDVEKENSAMWREIALLRHRTAKQKAFAQQIVRFLVPKKRNKCGKRKGTSKQVNGSPSSHTRHPDVVRFCFQSKSAHLTRYSDESMAGSSTDVSFSEYPGDGENCDYPKEWMKEESAGSGVADETDSQSSDSTHFLLNKDLMWPAFPCPTSSDH